ncbi:hypothetical protein C3432_09920 [Citrobacter amalonaticus]|uniref:Uncharacterized protein n=1 Tax=Citrobacter amalonaticus TaxID=35703 RepID=A0A2S4RZY5_CITAM|nr:hypothetical protein C3432_09920 [Citrobacter amalonaticus]POT76262.1 hypothetical protein C3436_01900 [Citrobacter amalonaticus]POU66739.1 hypothetical protein C3430_08120 [Citrobacter amalonaticus]POV05497.1 hypothetical protein C3424_09205 [Citrobacter amalonaticus]
MPYYSKRITCRHLTFRMTLLMSFTEADNYTRHSSDCGEGFVSRPDSEPCPFGAAFPQRELFSVDMMPVLRYCAPVMKDCNCASDCKRCCSALASALLAKGPS